MHLYAQAGSMPSAASAVACWHILSTMMQNKQLPGWQAGLVLLQSQHGLHGSVQLLHACSHARTMCVTSRPQAGHMLADPRTRRDLTAELEARGADAEHLSAQNRMLIAQLGQVRHAAALCLHGMLRGATAPCPSAHLHL